MSVQHTDSLVNTLLADSLKIYPALAESAMRAHQEKEHRAWAILRAHDEDGRGWVALDDARAVLHGALLAGSRTVARLLRAGQGQWWTISAGRLWYTGLQPMCTALDTVPGHPVIIPLKKVRKLKAWRAECTAARFARHGALDRPTALATISKRVAKTPRTVHTYLKAAGVQVEHNSMASATAPKVKDSARTETPDPERQRQGWYRVKTAGGRVELRRRLPNSYKSHRQQAPYGRAGKVRLHRKRSARVSWARANSATVYVTDRPAGQKARRAVSRLQEGATAYLLYRPPTRRDADGARLWEGYQAAGGTPYRL